MSILETLGILFMAVVAINAIIAVIAIKNAIPEEQAHDFAQEASLHSLNVSKI